jgi:hypothetical protein
MNGFLLCDLLELEQKAFGTHSINRISTEAKELAVTNRDHRVTSTTNRNLALNLGLSPNTFI